MIFQPEIGRKFAGIMQDAKLKYLQKHFEGLGGHTSGGYKQASSLSTSPTFHPTPSKNFLNTRNI